MNIIKSSTPMRKKDNDNASLETECLFGENVIIIDERSDWVNCRLITDNYCGWIRKIDLGKLDKVTHRVITPRTFIYKDANPKSDIATYLTMGSQLCVGKIKDEWAETYFWYNDIFNVGYVPSKHIAEMQHIISDWVAIAQKLEETPYKWGGRDTLGLDCSALLQLSYQTYGQTIPRNTSDQVKLIKPTIRKINQLKRGCVIFWKGHVGIMVDSFNCIHANAYHMKTVTEPLFDIIKRTNKDNQIVKMMNFN